MVKVKRSIVVGISIILTAFLYIYAPLSDPTIEIDTSYGLLNLDIELPKEFSKCILTFDNEILVSEYSMGFQSKNEVSGKARARMKKDVDQIINELTIHNLMLNKSLRSDDKEDLYIRIKVLFKANTSFKITKIFVGDKKQDIETFYENNLFYNYKKLKKHKYIRDDISLLLLNYNDPLSNIIMTVLFIFFFPLTFDLIVKLVRLYKRNKLKKYLHNKYNLSTKLDINNAKIATAEDYMRADRGYRLMQIIGPAIGFTLTISSLIAGLNPSLQKIQNIKVFFEIIQIAMVSTLLGLLMRILSIWLQQINNKLLIQADEIFFALEEKIKTDDAKNG